MQPKGYDQTTVNKTTGERKRGRPSKANYDQAQLDQAKEHGIIRLNNIISKVPLVRSINNPFTFPEMSKLYGEKFTFSFFLKLKELYKAKDNQQCSALSIPSILAMLNRILAERVRRANQYYAKNDIKHADGTPRRVSGQSLLLCHVYLMLAYLYRHDNQLLNTTKRSFYSHTELELEEINFIAQLWSRGFGHQFIAANCGIEMPRVRPFYRSLEEASRATVGEKFSRTGFSNGGRISTNVIDSNKIVNQLYHWIKKNAQSFTLGDHELYAIKKQELEDFVIVLEAKQNEEPKQIKKLGTEFSEVDNQLDGEEDFFSDDDLGIPLENLPEAPPMPDVIDPLADESYGVTSSETASRASMLGNVVDTRRDIPVDLPPISDIKGEELLPNKQFQQASPPQITQKPTFPTAETLDSMPQSIPDEVKPEQLDPQVDTKPFIPATEKAKELSDLFKNG